MAWRIGLSKNDQIKMVSEDLRISPSLVCRVPCRNESDMIELGAFHSQYDFVGSMMARPKLNWWNFKTL